MLYVPTEKVARTHMPTRMTGARRAISSCDCASLDSTRTTLSTFNSCKQEEPRTGSSNSTLSADASGGHERVSRDVATGLSSGGLPIERKERRRFAAAAVIYLAIRRSMALALTSLGSCAEKAGQRSE